MWGLLALAFGSAATRAEPQLILLTDWTVIQYGRFEQGPGYWFLSSDGTIATQQLNADPSILLSDFTLQHDRIQGSLRVDEHTDGDLIGFVFGYQDDRHFYLFDWKQTRQSAPTRGVAEQGMSVKVVNASSEITRSDFWATFPSNTNRVHTIYHNEIPWMSATDYEFQLDFLPGFFSITVSQGGNILDVIQLKANAYLTGRFGFYNSSQAQARYSQFITEPLPPRPALSISGGSVAEGNDGATDLLFEARLSEPSAERVSALAQTTEATATDGEDYLGLSDLLVEFQPGETTQVIRVPILGDLLDEPDEAFAIHLRRVENAVFGIVDAEGIIIDDDAGTNEPPTIAITTPVEGANFGLFSTVTIVADAVDPDGEVLHVDFFSGTNFLGRATEAPFAVLWEPAALGGYTLTARATDNVFATGDSAPVHVTVSVATNAQVAIVRNFPHPEIELLQRYLAEMEYTSLVFDQEGLTAADLEDFLLVIWDDLGEREQGLSDAEVMIFEELLGDDIPLYFIGERIASSAGNLTEPTRSTWQGLTHLNSSPVTGGTGFVGSSPDGHPVTDGPFGTVTGFPYPPTMDPAVQGGFGGERIGFSGETDVLVAHESSDGAVRTLTQNVLVSSAPECGLAVRKRLFKNAVWWLMQEFDPPRFLNLFMSMEQSADSITAGDSVFYTITASHSGELAARNVILVDHLPPGMSLLSVTSSQGSCSNFCGVLVCELGELSQSAQATVTLSAIPSQAGRMTNVVTLSSDDPEPRIIDNIKMTVLEATDPLHVEMNLGIKLVSPAEARVELEAPVGLRYQIEVSGDMENWELWQDFVATEPVHSFTNSFSPFTPAQFFRALLP